MAKSSAVNHRTVSRAAAARLARRRKPLRQRRVGEITYKRYRAAMSLLMHWWTLQGVSLSHVNDIDEHAGAYVEHLWGINAGLSEARVTLAALQFFLPTVKKKLGYSWELIRTWQKAEPPSRAAPITPGIVLGFCGMACQLGLRSLACVWLLGFSALLRTGEFMIVRKRHLSFNRALTRLVVHLPSTKSGNRYGTKELVVVESETTIRFVYEHARNLHADDLLCNLSVHRVRLVFNLLCDQFHLSGFGLNLYSFRRGGATHDFLAHSSAERTIIKGRWQNLATARLYLQEGVAALLDLRMSEDTRALLALAAQWLFDRPSAS